MASKNMILLPICIVMLLLGIFSITACSGDTIEKGAILNSDQVKNISLPDPSYKSDNALDNALENRRSIRAFESKPMTSDDLSLLLWAGQGITNSSTGQRTSPSAMRTYPLTLHIVISNVTGITPGVYAYIPAANILKPELDEAEKNTLLEVMGGRRPLNPTPVIMIFEANYSPFLKVQGTEEEAIRHACLEAGHVAQNILLMETSRGLAGTPFTGFNTEQVEKALNISDDHHIIYALSAGYPDN